MKNKSVPQLVAHRGFSARYPENTLLSLEKALQEGACYLECDVQLTRDAVPVLVHDHILRRTTGRAGNIHDLTYEELRSFSAGYPDRFGDQYQNVPLADVMQLVSLMQQWPGRRVFVEMKRASIRQFGREAMLNALLKALQPIRGQVILISFEADIIRLAQRNSDFQTGWVFEHWIPSNLQTARELQANFIFADWECVPADMEVLPEITAQWVIYEIDEWQDARRWIEKGASMIETNDIAALLGSPYFKNSRCDD